MYCYTIVPVFLSVLYCHTLFFLVLILAFEIHLIYLLHYRCLLWLVKTYQKMLKILHNDQCIIHICIDILTVSQLEWHDKRIIPYTKLGRQKATRYLIYLKPLLFSGFNLFVFFSYSTKSHRSIYYIESKNNRINKME